MEDVMKKILAVAACALFAGCLEPQDFKEEKSTQAQPPKNETVFDDDLEWISVKSVRILSTGDKLDEIDRINISTKQDIERALKEGALHWITDSIFIRQSRQNVLIREYRRDAPKFYEYPRGKYVLEFVPTLNK